jgi:cell division protease FtsH
MEKSTIGGLLIIIFLCTIGVGGIYYLYIFTRNIKWVDLLPFIVIIALLIIVIFQILLYVRLNPNKTQEYNKKYEEEFSSAPLRTYQDMTSEKVTFDDVAGLDDAKEESKRILSYLNDPEKFKKLGAKMPKGFIFEGPPGMGKTFLAKALANEANVPFLYISAAELIELFVGVGASRIRSIFNKAKKNAPCIVFIDELDAIAQKRSPVPSFSPGADEREQTINQLLSNLDGIDGSDGIIVIAATNRIEVIDPAITRPGRFDSIIHVELSSSEERSKLLDIATKSMAISSVINTFKTSQKMKDFSGAEIVSLCNRAALLAGDEGSSEISNIHFDSAIEFMINQRKFESSLDKIFQMAMNGIYFVKEKHKVRIETFSRTPIEGQLIWISPDSIKLEIIENGKGSSLIIPRGAISAIREIE